MIHSTHLLLDRAPIEVYYDFEDNGPDEPLEVKINRISHRGGVDNLLLMTKNEPGTPDEPLVHPDDVENIREAIVEWWKKPKGER